ncbi:MAG TPA: hypothetical protein VN969_19810 [Streptosporangiaceae bacterium]|jgi:hypothetical protein|nr:hypothetical protein [Streptosporangiaceae bacterium]
MSKPRLTLRQLIESLPGARFPGTGDDGCYPEPPGRDSRACYPEPRDSDARGCVPESPSPRPRRRSK